MTDPTHDEDVRLDRSITDAFCAECPSTACDLPGDQAKCATLLLIGSIWARGTDLYYALMEEHEADDPEPPRFENYLVPVVCTTVAVDASAPHSAYVQAESPIWTAWNKRRAAHDKVEGMRYDS